MRSSIVASVLGLAMIVGCSSSGYKAAEKTNNSLSDVKSELITDKAQLKDATDSLNDLVYRPQSDLRPQFEKYAAAVNALDKSATASRKSARNMVDNREAYLSKWKTDVASMTDVDLRMRAMDRIRTTEDNFSAVGNKLVAANNDLAPLVSELQAMKVYLSSDLTAAGIKSITDRATAAKNKSITVNNEIDEAITELDKVSDQIAPMPATQPTTMGSM